MTVVKNTIRSVVLPIQHGVTAQLGSKLKYWEIPITGRTSGTPTAGTMVMSFSEDVEIESTGDVTISVARAVDSIYRKHTITVNCTNNGSGKIKVPKAKLVSLGNHNGASNPNVNFYLGDNSTAPIVSVTIEKIPKNTIKIRQASSATFLICLFAGTGSLPSSLEYLNLYFAFNSFNYISSSPMPHKIKYVYVYGASLINWFLFDFSGDNDITDFNLSKIRYTKITSSEMVQMLQSLTNRIGDLPTTITINDYADFADPPQEVNDAVAALLAAKSTITVNLGA